MKQTLKKIGAFLLVACMICSIAPAVSLSVFSGATATAAAATPTDASVGDVFSVRNDYELINDYLSIAMLDGYEEGYNGRYTIGTTGGDPTNPQDDNMKMLFGWPRSNTTTTTVSVDSNTTVFYKSGDITYDTENGRIVCSNVIDGIRYTQTLSFVNCTGSGRYDCVEIRYDAENVDTASHNVGLRIMLDTMLANNDDAPFKVSGIGDVTTQMEFSGSDIPLYWQAFDSLTEPTIMSQGSFVVYNGNEPDTVQFTNWGQVYEYIWDCPVREGASNGDSAVTVKWNEKPLAPGESRSYTTYYGLAAITLPPEDDGDEIDDAEIVLTSGLNVTVSDNAYVPNPMEYNIYLANDGTASTGDITCTVELEEDSVLECVDGSEYAIGAIAPGGEKQQTIKIFVNRTPVEKTEVIKFHFTSTSGDDITVEKTITIPALEKPPVKNKVVDLAFVIDTTGSMGDDIDTVKANMRKYVAALSDIDIDFRIAIVDYRDFPDRPYCDPCDYPYHVQMDFSADPDAIQRGINGLDLGNGGDTRETVYSGLIDGQKELSWRDGSAKFAIVMGDACPLDPEPYTYYTADYVIRALRGVWNDGDVEVALEDRVASSPIYPVVLNDAISVYAIISADCPLLRKVAEETGGKYIQGDDVDDAISDLINNVLPYICKHEWSETITKEATCENDGESRTVCTLCGKEIVSVIPGGHIMSYTEGTPATCVEPGNITYYKCERAGCGKLFTDAEGVNEISESDIILPSLGHDWNDGEITTPATCTTDGVKTYTCNRCGETKEDPIPGEHDLVRVERKEPNCILEGNIEYYQCSVCGKCFTDAEGRNEIPEEDTILPATGEHDWDEGTVSVEPTCTANGLKVYICSVCGETKNEIIEKLPHDLHHVTNPATCAVEGVEYDVCTTCETIFNHVLTPKTDHTWDEGEVKSVGDCVTEGLKVFTCTVCGATREERTPVTGHSWGPWSFVKVPTYREGGSAERECKVCHEKETKEYGKVIPDITKKHDDTGVEIGFMKDTYGKDIDLKVTNTYDGSSYNFLNKEKGNFQFEIYDISTIEAGTETKLQPTGTVLVRLPIPADYSRDNLVIYYVTSTGTIEKMDMWIEGDFACFEAEHFSHYALVDESAEKVTFGDVDGDRQITSGDARLALRRSVKLENFEIGSLTFRACDVDFDGEVTSSDARSILRASVQLEKPEDWRK